MTTVKAKLDEKAHIVNAENSLTVRIFSCFGLLESTQILIVL